MLSIPRFRIYLGATSARLGPASAAASSAPTPGAVRRRAGGGGVVQGACGLGLYVLARMSWPVCLGLYVLVCMSWPVCLGLSCLGLDVLVLMSWPFMSWGCCLGFSVLKFLFAYGICGGLTLSRYQTSVSTIGCLHLHVETSI